MDKRPLWNHPPPQVLGNKILWKIEARLLKNPAFPLVHRLKGAGSKLSTFNFEDIECAMWESITFSRFDRREVRASNAHVSVYTLVNNGNRFPAKLSSCDAFPWRKTQSISSSGELNGPNPVPFSRGLRVVTGQRAGRVTGFTSHSSSEWRAQDVSLNMSGCLAGGGCCFIWNLWSVNMF